MKPKILLASSSPYRKKLLSRIVDSFDCAKPLCDEELLKNGFQGELVTLPIYLAKQKALSLKEHYPDHIIIGSDQALYCQGQFLGKGHNFEGAFKQLQFLSGKTATLITATSVLHKGQELSFECNPELHFRELSDKKIYSYLEVDTPFDCAGSFKIESRGATLFKKITSEDPSAIEGLPLMKLCSVLEELM